MERSLARLMIIAGSLLVAAGLAILFGPRIPWLGRLPGDMRFSRGGTSIYFPLMSCLLLSLLLTLLFNLLRRR